MDETMAAERVPKEVASRHGVFRVSKIAHLVRLLSTRPTELWERLATKVESGVDSYRRQPFAGELIDWHRVVSDLGRLWNVDLEGLLQEDELKRIERAVLNSMELMPQDAPFGSFHNADLCLARLCYALARVIQPSVIVETGVCYGVTSAFLLKALQVNGRGTLHSIDLPPLGKDADQFVGKLIPADLRANWKLYRGASRQLLPRVLEAVEAVGLFVHDSLHTYRNMLYEFQAVQPYLASTAAVVADDIDGNRAFHDWVEETRPQYSAAVQEQSKRSLFGVAMFQPGSTSSA